jgi:hypothetical protein
MCIAMNIAQRVAARYAAELARRQAVKEKGFWVSNTKIGEKSKRTKLKATTLEEAKKEALKMEKPEKGKTIAIWTSPDPRPGEHATASYYAAHSKWLDG